MKTRLFVVLLLGVISSTASAKELVYQGGWKTTNRKLDGDMTCVVTPLGDEQWRGRFHGIWQGVPFDYTVDFTGPPKDLTGKATIDGAAYQWKALMNKRQFKANFTGDRYTGSFDLKRVEDAAVSQKKTGTAAGPPRTR